MPRRKIRYLWILLLVIAVPSAILFLARHTVQPKRFTQTETDKPEVCVQQGHGEAVLCVAWSPDGKFALSGAADGKVILWDVRTGRELREVAAHEVGGAVSAVYLPEGNRFLTAGTDGTVRLWDLNTMIEVKRFRAGGPITSIALSASGTRLLCTAMDSMAWLWDVPSGKLLRHFLTDSLGSSCSALSPDGGLAVLQGLHSGTLALWDANSGKRLRELALSENSALSVSFLRNGSEILCVSGSGRELQSAKGAGSWSIGAPRAPRTAQQVRNTRSTFEVWSVESGQRIRCFGSDAVGVTTAQVLPDGKRLLSSGLDSTLELWDIATGNLLREFPNSGCPVSAAAVSGDGRFALAGGTVLMPFGYGTDRNMIGVWDMERGLYVRTLERNALTALGVAFSPTGDQLRVMWLCGVHAWDVHTARRLSNFVPDPDRHAIIRNGNMSCGAVGTQDPDCTIFQFWSLENGRQGICEKLIRGFSSSYDFTDDGHYGITVSQDTVFTLWDARSGHEVDQFVYADTSARRGTAWCTDVYLLGQGRRAAARHCTPEVCIYDFATRQKRLLRSSGSSADVFSIVPLFDNERMAVARADGSVEFWNTRTAEMLRSYQLEGPVDLVVLSPDERVFAAKILRSSTSEVIEGTKRTTVESWNGTVLGLWDAVTGQKIREFTGHTGFINQVGMSPDGRFVVSSATDGTARIWNTNTGKEILKLVSFVNEEWIAITPEGYYTASINGDAYLTVRVGNKVTGIEQYRTTFYQPAVVEAALRLGDSELAIHEVLGCREQCTTLADVPEMEPPSLVIQYPADGDTLNNVDTTLAFHVEDRRNPIASVRVFVNGRPVRSSRSRNNEGINLPIPHDQRTLDLKVPLRLDEGDNLITVAALGRSEVVDTLHVYVVPKEDLTEKMEIDTVWILAVGINRYQDPMLRSLRYCVNDAQGVVQAFKDQEGRVCRKVMSRLITDAGPLKPTAETIMDNLRFLHQAKPEDLAILFLAGHGMKNARGDFYFLPADAVMEGPQEFRTSRAISGSQLQWAMDAPARRFVFVDACHSGDVGVDLVKLARDFKDDRVLIMTSSEGTKPSEEADSLRHGLFTYAVIEGMSGAADRMGIDGKVSALELITYVSERVLTLTRQRQNPVFWAPGGLSNFVVAVSAKSPGRMVASLLP